MMGYISYFNVVKSRDIISSPYNKRQDSYADRVIQRKDSGQKWKCAGSDTMWQKMGQRQENIRTNNIFAHVVGYTAQGKIWSGVCF